MSEPEPVRATPASRPLMSRLNRMFDAKLTPGIAVLFFVGLALMCAVAAGIGYVTHSLGHAAAVRR